MQLIDSKPLCWTQVGRGVDGFDAGHHRDQGHDPHQEHHGQVGGGSCLSSPKVRLCDVEKEEYDHLDRMSKGSVVLALSPGESDNRLKQRRRKAASVAAAHLFPLCPPSPSLFNPPRNLHPPPTFGQCSRSLRQALCYDSGVNSVFCSLELQRFHRRGLLVLVNPIEGNP